MRKNAIYFMLIPLAVLFVVIYFFLDSWVESAIEESVESVTGAKVEIENFHIKYFPVGIEWLAIQVANPYDPWTNLFETGKVKCEINTTQLLRKKFIAETVVAGEESVKLQNQLKTKFNSFLAEKKRV